MPDPGAWKFVGKGDALPKSTAAVLLLGEVAR